MPEPHAIYEAFVVESGIVYRELLFGSIHVDAASVRCPVLCAGGHEDRIISRRLLRRTARHYGAELLEHPGHAHWLYDEPGWDAIAADVLAWLRGLS